MHIRETKFQFDTFNEHSDLTDSSTLSPLGGADVLLSPIIIVTKVVEVNLVVVLYLQAYLPTETPEKSLLNLS